MLTIACVLRSGGEYTPAHVADLRDMVARNLLLPHRFVCLSDVAVDCERIPLEHGWPGWWSKMELWRGCLFDGPMLYFDLDTIIVGSLDEIASGIGKRVIVLRNFWAESYGEPDRIGSGMMAWGKEAGPHVLVPVYLKFAKSPRTIMSAYTTTAHWGDQAFIKENVAPDMLERWQDKFPGKVVSFKKHVIPAKRVPDGAAVCCFHGEPRPWAMTPKQRSWFERVREAA